MFKWL
jgi:hypothetical protein